MRKAIDIAKYFIKLDLDEPQGTPEGNIKLQQLLVLANLASLAEYGEPLFDDEIMAVGEFDKNKF